MTNHEFNMAYNAVTDIAKYHSILNNVTDLKNAIQTVMMTAEKNYVIFDRTAKIYTDAMNNTGSVQINGTLFNTDVKLKAVWIYTASGIYLSIQLVAE